MIKNYPNHRTINHPYLLKYYGHYVERIDDILCGCIVMQSTKYLPKLFIMADRYATMIADAVRHLHKRDINVQGMIVFSANVRYYRRLFLQIRRYYISRYHTSNVRIYCYTTTDRHKRDLGKADIFIHHDQATAAGKRQY